MFVNSIPDILFLLTRVGLGGEATWANAIIKNGETVTFPIREQKCSVVVWARTSTGAACGPAYYLEEG
ncbi:MAG: hypothetical protein IIU53_07755, partial [Rikenellaceae bacterium]|nr:hypothetical protein [Rikenellaceae bacterium]